MKTTLDYIKEIGGDPLAEYSFMDESIQQLGREELLGIIDILFKEREYKSSTIKTLCEMG